MSREVARRLVELALVLALAAFGCVHVGPSPRPPVDLYDLAPLSPGDLPAGRPPAAWSLVVEEPTAAGALAGDRLSARPTSRQLQPLAGGRWTEPAPRMVQRLLLESLEAAGLTAGRPESGLKASHRLVTDLRAFEVDLSASGAAPVARIRLGVLLLHLPEGELVAARGFEASATAAGRDLPALVTAFDRAFHILATELVTWVRAQEG